MTNTKLYVLVALILADWLTTLIAIDAGATELNPIVAKFVDNPFLFTFVKFGSIGLSYFVYWFPTLYSGEKRRQLLAMADALVLMLVGYYAIVVGNNIYQLAKYYLKL